MFYLLLADLCNSYAERDMDGFSGFEINGDQGKPEVQKIDYEI